MAMRLRAEAGLQIGFLLQFMNNLIIFPALQGRRGGGTESEQEGNRVSKKAVGRPPMQ